MSGVILYLTVLQNSCKTVLTLYEENHYAGNMKVRMNHSAYQERVKGKRVHPLYRPCTQSNPTNVIFDHSRLHKSQRESEERSMNSQLLTHRRLSGSAQVAMLYAQCHCLREHLRNARDNLYSILFFFVVFSFCRSSVKTAKTARTSRSSFPKEPRPLLCLKTQELGRFLPVTFRGASVKLEPNSKYEYPYDMGLQRPVKSFRKAP